LAKNPQTRSASIQVFARNGAVSITGNVNSQGALELMATIARGVPGVTSFTCEAGMGTDWYW
jgi:osmotically-inducible protein OsmY